MIFVTITQNGFKLCYWTELNFVLQWGQYSNGKTFWKVFSEYICEKY